MLFRPALNFGDDNRSMLDVDKVEMVDLKVQLTLIGVRFSNIYFKRLEFLISEPLWCNPTPSSYNFFGLFVCIRIHRN